MLFPSSFSDDQPEVFPTNQYDNNAYETITDETFTNATKPRAASATLETDDVPGMPKSVEQAKAVARANSRKR